MLGKKFANGTFERCLYLMIYWLDGSVSPRWTSDQFELAILLTSFASPGPRVTKATVVSILPEVTGGGSEGEQRTDEAICSVIGTTGDVNY